MLNDVLRFVAGLALSGFDHFESVVVVTVVIGRIGGCLGRRSLVLRFSCSPLGHPN